MPTDEPVLLVLGAGEQVEEQGPQTGRMKDPGHMSVPRAVTATATSVGEHDDPSGNTFRRAETCPETHP